MISTIEGRRRPLPSIATVYRPIEEYCQASRTPHIDPSAAPDPLDAFLIYRLLELVPGHPVLVDTAIAETGGATTLIGLLYPRVRAVWAVADPDSPATQRAIARLREHVDARESGAPPLSVVASGELHEKLADTPGAVILVDARHADTASMTGDVGRWLDARPDGVVLVLGLGRVGECPAIDSLLSACSAGSERRFRLLRELGEVLMSSRLGVVARRDHPWLDTALIRLEHLYTGNYRYVDLVWQSSRAALREANVDSEALRSHPTFGAISEEIEGLKRALRDANERAAAATASASARVFPHPAAPAWSPMTALRRRLSPTPIGQAWRLARRAKVKLSPTPVGRAYRMTRRITLALLPRGR